MPQLDGLRAVAVGGVLVSHFSLLRDVGPLRDVGFLLGSVGVDLFFTLSGFLITGILLGARGRMEQGRQALGFSLRTFYARRVLRIFPIYYGTILLLWLWGMPAVRENLVWLVTYTANLKIALTGEPIPPLGHFWTLAVEEQFYLVWPAVVFLVPRRALVPGLIGVALAALAFRTSAFVAGGDANLIHLATPSCFGTLALGSLLAVVSERRSVTPELLRRLRRIAVVSGAVVVALLVTADPPFLAYWTFSGPWLAMAFLWLIARSARGADDPLGRLLSWGPAVGMGRISYGIYVFHPLVELAGDAALERLGLESLLAPAPRFVILTASSIGMAAVSWRFFEGPINGLKRYFPTRPTALGAPGPPTPGAVPSGPA